MDFPMDTQQPICLGDPFAPRLARKCSEHAGIVHVQLRPDPEDRPVMVAVASCPTHSDAVVRYMVESWPHDDIYITSFVEWVAEQEPMYESIGVPTQLVAVPA